MKLLARKTKNQFAPRNISLPDNRRKYSRKWVLILATIVSIAILVVTLQLVQTQLFQIEEVKVVQLVGVKPHVVPNDQLQRLASGMRGQSLLLLNENKVIDDWLVRMPGLQSMYIKKEYPNTLIIQYVPRVAFSQLIAPLSAFLVDREGYIFAKNEAVDYLPKVLTDQEKVTIGETTSAQGVRLAQHLIEGLRNTNPRLVNVLLRNGVLELTMTGDPKLLISEDKSAAPTLHEIRTLLLKFAEDEKYPKEIDMRYDRPILRY